MKCPRCQHENGSKAKFCQECATPLSRTCLKCGNELPSTAKFCPECAHPAGNAEAIDPGRFSSPETYTPKHLAEKILTSKAALEGERKQVTVLFADLKGSMELLADRDPEEARKLLDPVLEHMMEAVHRYEGTVNQVMGDGIMALFGAPVAHEDHAVRACYAALRMQQSVKRYAEGVRREHGVTIRIRIGLNSGEVVVRAIGSDLQMDYSAVGQTTHLAARMEQLADPGSILLTPHTLVLAEGFVQVNSLGPMAVKGLLAPVEVYELAGVSVVRSRFQASAARGLSRFVGRDAEVEQLHRALDQAHVGKGQLAAIVGEPGVGKSRLVFELTRSHRVNGWLVLEASSVSYGKATSYLPVIDLLKSYFRIGEHDTHRDIREKATGKILTLDRSLEPMLPALLALLDTPVEDARWRALDPSLRRQQTLDAVKRLLIYEARIQPVLLVFEDLHWIDAETQALLDSVVESLPTTHVLLLVNYRPEYSHGWGGKTFYSQLRLDTLELQSTRQLLDALLGADLSLGPLKALLADKTSGNPLFLEESVRTLVETGSLIGEPGSYRLARSVAMTSVPATVQAILAARIDRLAPEDKRILETAAVIGKDFPFVLLEQISEESEAVLRRSLGRLQSAEFLYETSLFPDLEYTFKHALTHDVTYRGLLHERRKALHARIISASQHLYGDRVSEQVEQLALHAFKGEEWATAVGFYRQAGDKALSRWAYQAAATNFEQAIIAAGHLPEDLETGRLGIDLRMALRTALFPLALGNREKILDHLREAELIAERIGDDKALARVLPQIASELWFIGDFTLALEAGTRAMAVADSLNDPVLMAMARYRWAQPLQDLGDFRQAAEVQRSIHTGLESHLRHDGFGLGIPLYAASGVWLCFALAERGEFGEGVRIADEIVRLSESLSNAYSLAHCLWALGEVWLQKGELDKAQLEFERGVREAAARGIEILRAANGAGLGYTLALRGQAEEGERLLEDALQSSERTGMAFPRNVWLVRLAEVRLAGGALNEAKAAARQALDGSRSRRERGREAWTLRILGEISRRSEPPDYDEAEAHFVKAMDVAAELGMRPLVAHCHLGLGKLDRRTDQRERAGEHLTAAATMYREMGMTYWLEKAEAEMEKPR